MNNFNVVLGGSEYWISRSIAVVIKFIAYDKYGIKYILAVKRGKGTPDPEFIGSWCYPCGYLDYNETIKEAAVREVYEETGVKLNIHNLILFYINDNPNEDKRQNVTFRYRCTIKEPIEDIKLTNKNSEEKEVSDIKWIPIEEIDNYKWAFNHDKIIKEQV